MEFDEIIVGSGSSGAVLAARLSEDAGRSVLLIEAGPDYKDTATTPTTLLNCRRVAHDYSWLLPARRRTNLKIMPDTLVDRVIFDGSRAVGIEVSADGGATQMISGRRITLSGGTVGTPAILLRSGVGPPEDLRALGIEVKIPLTGVGENLIDHAGLSANWQPAPGVVQEDTPYIQAILRYTANGSLAENDMQAILFQAQAQPALQLRSHLMKPHSRGTLKLRSKDPSVQPDIRLNLASDPEDVRRLGEGLRLLGRFIQTPQLGALGADNVAPGDGEMMSAHRFADLLQQPDWVQEHIVRAVRHYVHPVGTARMGPAGDPGAVVDQHCRVHGASGLMVVDASVMPTIPRANTHLACVMIAERAAEWMRDSAN